MELSVGEQSWFHNSVFRKRWLMIQAAMRSDRMIVVSNELLEQLVEVSLIERNDVVEEFAT